MSNRLRRVLQLVISNFNLAGIAVNFNHLSADRGRYWTRTSVMQIGGHLECVAFITKVRLGSLTDVGVEIV